MGVLVIIRKACAFIKESKSIILDRRSQWSMVSLVRRGLRYFLKSEGKVKILDLWCQLRGYVAKSGVWRLLVKCGF